MRVFISHGRETVDVARGLASHLRNAGINPWLAEISITPGDPVATSIRNALAHADAAVLLIGPSEPTAWVRAEWSMILDASWRSALTRIVPMSVDGAELPGFLRAQQAVHVTSEPETWESAFAQVLSTLLRT